ncbi:uncharacterized protein LOC126656351 [Mercurialis annua]|uniref:uncharacterized protein LOC126656351 n=1 Tax=Mercurialis annua TaxID=3986 RepID=UPI00215E2CE0|nr:uncharacterized protein LOC126656351 [Mercurialis annua]
MYPRVKVMQQDQDQEPEHEHEHEHSPRKEFKRSLLFLKIIESLAIQEKENQSESPDSPPSLVARITKPNVLSLTPPPPAVSATKVKNDKNIGAENNRAQSTFRPRAVLSSPANDEIIGSRSKTGKSLAPRKCNSELRNQNQIKAIATQNKVEKPLSLNLRRGSSIKNMKLF